MSKLAIRTVDGYLHRLSLNISKEELALCVNEKAMNYLRTDHGALIFPKHIVSIEDVEED